jgi:hypothetical protein
MRGLRGGGRCFIFYFSHQKAAGGKESRVGEGTSLALRTKMRSTALQKSKNQFTLFPSVEWLKPLKNA